MCKVLIKNKNWLGLGFTESYQCNNPAFKDDMCKGHYKRSIEKAIPYKDREGYREPTMEEIKNQKLLHLKHLGSHGGFRYQKGQIVYFNTEKPSNLAINPELFVIKI